MKKDDPRMHGHECEPEARQAYIDRKASEGCPVSVTQHGLIVDRDLPFLASSPDGIIHEAGPRGLLEIKCPVKPVPVEELLYEQNCCLGLTMKACT